MTHKQASEELREKIVETVFEGLPGYFDIDFDYVMSLIHSYGIEQRIDELKRLTDFSLYDTAVRGRHQRSYEDRIATLEAQRKEKE